MNYAILKNLKVVALSSEKPSEDYLRDNNFLVAQCDCSIGDEFTLTDGTLTLVVKDPSVLLQQAKDRQWAKIKALRDHRKSQGGIKVGTKWFHSDDASRIQQIGLVMMGANIPANTQWKTMDGSFVTMTQTLAGQIFQASAANDMAIFAAAETHKTAMEASADPASYDYSQGWPKAFGEP